MSTTSRKSGTRAVFMMPQDDSTSKTPQTTYWMDSSGKMWYSGPKKQKRKSILARSDENATPATSVAAGNSTDYSKGKSAVRKAREAMASTSEFRWLQLTDAPTEPPTTATTFNADNAIDTYVPKPGQGSDLPAARLPTTRRRLWPNAWWHATILLCLLLTIEITLRYFGLTHALSTRNAGADAPEAREAAPLNHAGDGEWISVVGTAFDADKQEFTAIIDTAHMMQRRPGKVGALCVSVRGRKDAYASMCVNPSGYNPPAPQMVFAVGGLDADDYTFGAVAWDNKGKKVMVYHSFTVAAGTPKPSSQLKIAAMPL